MGSICLRNYKTYGYTIIKKSMRSDKKESGQEERI